MSDTPGVTLQFPDGRTFGPAPMETIVEWARQGRIPADATVSEAGSPPMPAGRHPQLAALAVAAAPPTQPGAIASAPADSPISGLIPYRNAPALVGYYISVGSLIPLLALILGPTAVILGIYGVKAYKDDNRRKGMAHAIVAISLGSLTTLGNIGLLVLPFVLR
ncbi:MAG: hypothetical protein ACREJO_16420 [Phycisphaerales bacterium]